MSASTIIGLIILIGVCAAIIVMAFLAGPLEEEPKQIIKTTSSCVTVKDIWPHLCDLGIIRLTIDNRVVWEDSQDEGFVERYKDIVIDKIWIKVVEFCHIIAVIDKQEQ